jgi:hypothetical protein
MVGDVEDLDAVSRIDDGVHMFYLQGKGFVMRPRGTCISLVLVLGEP